MKCQDTTTNQTGQQSLQKLKIFKIKNPKYSECGEQRTLNVSKQSSLGHENPLGGKKIN
jgi:hypothetical protein